MINKPKLPEFTAMDLFIVFVICLCLYLFVFSLSKCTSKDPIEEVKPVPTPTVVHIVISERGSDEKVPVIIIDTRDKFVDETE